MNKWVRAGIAALSTALLATAVGYGTAAADGYDGGGRGSVEGDGSSFGSFRFHGHNGSDDPFDASGYFTGISPAGPALARLQGPISCLVVDGNRAGFIYQVADGSNPPVFNGQEVKVSIEDGGDGRTDRIGFGLAVPAGTNKTCTPDQTTSDVNKGGVEVHGEDND